MGLNIKTTMERIVLILAFQVIHVRAVVPATRCSNIITPENARIVNTPTNSVGSTIEFKCSKGYDMIGTRELLCTNGGEWSPKQTPTCQIKMCNHFGSVSHGSTFQYSSNGVPNGYGSSVRVVCNDGYVLEGLPDVTCKASGYWTGRPSCVESQCPPYQNMKSSCIKHSTLLGKFLFVICRDDVEVTRTGPDAIECIDGEWERQDTIMECYCDCTVQANFELVSVSNANHGYIRHNTTMLWSCKYNYKKISTEPIVCRDGQIGIPVCEQLSDENMDTVIVLVCAVVVVVHVIMCTCVKQLPNGRRNCLLIIIRRVRHAIRTS